MVETRLAAPLSPYPRRVFRYTHETRQAASLQGGRFQVRQRILSPYALKFGNRGNFWTYLVSNGVGVLACYTAADAAGSLHISLPKDFDTWPVVLVALSSW
jgi:hypothetical protein